MEFQYHLLPPKMLLSGMLYVFRCLKVQCVAAVTECQPIAATLAIFINQELKTIDTTSELLAGINIINTREILETTFSSILLHQAPSMKTLKKVLRGFLGHLCYIYVAASERGIRWLILKIYRRITSY